MDTSPFRKRPFAPAEVRRILRRAVDLAERSADTPGAERPLTQDEIERLGAELGLPVAAVRSAIAVDSAPAEIQASAWKAPRRILFEEEFDGTLPASRHEDLVDEIYDHMKDAGRTQVVGMTLTWTPTPGPQGQARPLTVTVRSRDGKTRVRIEENLQPTFVALFWGLGFGLGSTSVGIAVPIAINLSLLLGVSLGIAFVTLSLLLARFIYGKMVKNRTKQLTGLRDRLHKSMRASLSMAPARTRIALPASSVEGADVDAQAEAEAEQENEPEARPGTRRA